MRASIKLCTVSGISINIHATFFLLPLFFLIYGGIKSMVLVLILFFCVACHELTHSFVAKKFGIGVRAITLLPIGGIASMDKMPESPKQEFLISIAGPMFNIALAAVLFFVFHNAAWMPAEVLSNPAAGESWLHMIALIPWINIFLAAFNLLPAFPMDGGRLLRSLLASRMDYRKATRIAVSIGHVFAVIFVYFGLVHGRLILVLIAVFIYMAASAEESQVNLKESLKGVKVKDVLSTQFLSLQKDTTLAKVLEAILHTRQEDFPVMEGDRMAGFVTRSDVIRGMHESGPATLISGIMRTDVPSVTPEEKLATVQHLMNQHQIKALPVMRDSAVQGVITLEDIGRAYSIMARR